MRWHTVSKRMRDWPRVTDNEIYRGCDQNLLGIENRIFYRNKGMIIG